MTSKEIKEKLEAAERKLEAAERKLQDAERELQEAKIVAYNWKKLKYLC